MQAFKALSLLAAGAFSLETRFLSNSVQGICDSVPSEAGYFDIVDHKKYFYWSFESRTDPASDPVFLWLTGGPGCSSQIALFHENGPCKVSDDHKTTHPNPYSWNQNATVIYIDQPAGVGFSTGAIDDSTEVEVADDVYIFLQEFFKKNRQFQSNDFYVVGESYGGHYVPAVARRVAEGNERNSDVKINLKGIAIGNGLTDPLHQYGAFPDFSQQNGYRKLVSEKIYLNMKNIFWPQCRRLIEGCYQGSDYACVGSLSYCQNTLVEPQLVGNWNQYDVRIQCKVPGLCYDFSDVTDFIDQPHIRAALGVGNIQWESCNYQVNSNFAADVMKGYQQDVAYLLANNMRVLIYAGDADLVCNWLSNNAWTLALEWEHGEEFRSAAMHPWKLGGKAMGSLRTAHNLTFLRVFNAGHMVPLDQPEASLDMINAFFAARLA